MTLITVMDDAVTLPSWARWSSADRRTLSYLASMYQSPLNQWTLPIPGSEGILTAREPWVVPWSALHIWVSGVEVPTSQLLYALNASLVGLLIPVAGDQDGSSREMDESMDVFVRKLAWLTFAGCPPLFDQSTH